MLSENTILKAIHNVNTLFLSNIILRMLSENTILKAIHNCTLIYQSVFVTANAKWKYNFESNSQHENWLLSVKKHCEC